MGYAMTHAAGVALRAAKPACNPATPVGPSAAPSRLSQLQQTHGNQAVARLLVGRILHPQLRVGAVDDSAERDADRTAQAVLQQAPAAPPAARELAGTLRRACLACEREAEEAQPMTVQRKC